MGNNEKLYWPFAPVLGSRFIPVSDDDQAPGALIRTNSSARRREAETEE
jgi:hypothetical protein